MTNLPTPPPPLPEPLGGNPDLETKPGEDPWWWTRFVGEEKWWNQVWFRALVAAAIIVGVFVAVQLSG